MASFPPMGQQQTTLRTSIEARLGEPLGPFVKQRRAERQSWRRIALEITRRTDLDLTGEALRVWFVVRGQDVRDEVGA